MPSVSNKVIIACAGAGKTTLLVDEALARPEEHVAIVTYTHNNVNEINRRFERRCGAVPRRVDVMTWHSFLLRECARPYQPYVYAKQRIETIHFPDGRSRTYPGHANTEEYFFQNGNQIYSDKISHFIIDCEEASGGLVTRRLDQVYDAIFVDEVQDIAGWDLEWCTHLLASGIATTFVGDPRQCTYWTNNAAKNAQYRGLGFLKLVERWKKDGLCIQEDLEGNHRCNQVICDAANRLYPSMSPMKSLSKSTTGHDGVFSVPRQALDAYMSEFQPHILRNNKNADSGGHPAINFGIAKGMQCDRVLIVPTGPIEKYLKTGDPKQAGSIERLYVAMTRARYSVAFLYDDAAAVPLTPWRPAKACSDQ